MAALAVGVAVAFALVTAACSILPGDDGESERSREPVRPGEAIVISKSRGPLESTDGGLAQELCISYRLEGSDYDACRPSTVQVLATPGATETVQIRDGVNQCFAEARVGERVPACWNQ